MRLNQRGKLSDNFESNEIYLFFLLIDMRLKKKRKMNEMWCLEGMISCLVLGGLRECCLPPRKEKYIYVVLRLHKELCWPDGSLYIYIEKYNVIFPIYCKLYTKHNTAKPGNEDRLSMKTTHGQDNPFKSHVEWPENEDHLSSKTTCFWSHGWSSFPSLYTRRKKNHLKMLP